MLQLPIELKYTILSYLSLSCICKFNLTAAVWQFRYLLHFNAAIATVDKKLYLLRAATEQHEVCVDTFKLYPSISYNNLVNYYAAVASNWSLVRVPSSDQFLTEILVAAILGNQVTLVQDILNLRYREVWSEIKTDQNYVGNKTLIPTQDMLELLLSSFTRLPFDIQALIIAQMPLAAYKDYVTGGSDPMIHFWDNMFALFGSYKYNPNITNKIKIMLKIDSSHGVKEEIALFYNQRYLVNNDNQIGSNVLHWLAFNSLDDWLVDFNKNANGQTFINLKANYAYIPDALTRGIETVKILSQYVDQNPLLLKYISYIKIIAGVAEITDLKALTEITSEIIMTLLDNKQFAIVLQLDEFTKSHLREYSFTNVNALSCVVNCKNLALEGGSWIKIFTLPLLASILQNSNVINKWLLRDVERYIPDCVTLVKKLS